MRFNVGDKVVQIHPPHKECQEFDLSEYSALTVSESSEYLLKFRETQVSDLSYDPTRFALVQESSTNPFQKETNPKDAVGVAKVPMSTVPANVIAEIGLAMMEGSRKYGRHNFRPGGVRASVYYDAVFRHMFAWWEGQDIDPDSGLSHVTKAIASLVVLRDSMMWNSLTDDRPPKMENDKWVQELNEKAKQIIEKYPNGKAAHTQKDSEQ